MNRESAERLAALVRRECQNSRSFRIQEDIALDEFGGDARKKNGFGAILIQRKEDQSGYWFLFYRVEKGQWELRFINFQTKQ